MEAVPISDAHNTETSKPMNAASGGKTPLRISIAITTEERPILAPTEISKLPEIMRIVAPLPAMSDNRITTSSRKDHWFARSLFLIVVPSALIPPIAPFLQLQQKVRAVDARTCHLHLRW